MNCGCRVPDARLCFLARYGDPEENDPDQPEDCECRCHGDDTDDDEATEAA